jgi:hypothetical protein
METLVLLVGVMELREQREPRGAELVETIERLSASSEAFVTAAVERAGSVIASARV